MRNLENRERGAKVILVLMLAAGFAAGGSFFYLFTTGLIGKLWIVVWHNFQFPFALAILAVFGGFWKWKNPEEFTWGEFTAYVVVLPLVAFPLAAMFYYFATDLHDKEVWNGYAQRAVYEEEWTEEVHYTESVCTGSGKDEKCTDVPKTRYDYHPPSWYIETNNGESVSISSSIYRGYARHFGNEKFEYLFRSGQSSIGDGNMYSTVWKGEAAKLISTSVEHPFVNYLRASQSITKIHGNTAGYEAFLLPYPRVHDGKFGEIEFNRVLSAGVNLPADWAKTVDFGLDSALARLGHEKQVNILVYLTGADQGFFYALKEHWTDGKKNDVIVVIGSDGQNINWVQVQAWTKVELFKIQLADAIRSLKTLDGNANQLVSLITTQVVKEPQDGGFQRMPMHELEYLLVEIDLPWWASILMILANILVVSPIIVFLCNNQIRNNSIRLRRA